jgi:tRNA(Ile)-lysidine synthase
MEKTIEKVQQFIHNQTLFTPNQKLIVGVSGGADSVFLIHALHELGYACIIAHCNFHLRGEESDRDALFVKSLAENLNFPFRSIDFQTEKYASEQKISIEMAARELRYAWFAGLKEKEKADCIAIAHHSDDVVETFLINMTRGTGIHGLTGIKPKKGDIVRPLLALSRKEIEEYLQEKNISFVEDSTNRETIYVRNKFRNHIIPLLQTINPSFRESILQTAGHLQKAEYFIEDRLSKIKAELFTEKENSRYISIEKLKKEDSSLFILYELLHPYGFPASVIEDIHNGLDGIPGKQYVSEKYKILKDREYLILSGKKQEMSAAYSIKDTDTTIENPLQITITRKENRPDFSNQR